MIFLCRMIGVCAGFVIPVAGGLYASAVGNVKQANYFLRALIIWVIMDTICSPILSAFCGIVSGLLWPIAFSVISIALVIPRARAIEYGDRYIVSMIRSGKLNAIATKCIDLLQPFKSKVETFIAPSATKNA